MVWVYDRTGSLLVMAILMRKPHRQLNLRLRAGPSIHIRIPFLIMFFTFTGLLWLIVAAVTVVHRRPVPNTHTRRWPMCNQRHLARRAVGRDDLLRRPREFVMLVELVAYRVAATAPKMTARGGYLRAIFILLITLFSCHR